MTARQKQLKRKLIMKVHTSKLYREVYSHDRALYEEMLQNHFGTTSSKKLDIDQLIVLVDFLNQKRDMLPRMVKSDTGASAAQLHAIKELWGSVARDKSDTALRNFIHRITKNLYLHLENISRKDAQAVILALKQMEKAHAD